MTTVRTISMDTATMLLESVIRAKRELRGDGFVTAQELEWILTDVWAHTGRYSLADREFLAACGFEPDCADYEIDPDHRRKTVTIRHTL